MPQPHGDVLRGHGGEQRWGEQIVVAHRGVEAGRLPAPGSTRATEPRAPGHLLSLVRSRTMPIPSASSPASRVRIRGLSPIGCRRLPDTLVPTTGKIMVVDPIHYLPLLEHKIAQDQASAASRAMGTA